MKYTGWLISNNLFKRSFACLGHSILAYIIIIFAFLVILGVWNLIERLFN